jgi:hypothetical protein
MKNEHSFKIDEDGNKRYYLNGLLHREDGPAVEYVNRSKFWYQNGFLHRIDGPAVMFFDGDTYWWFHGQEISCHSQEEFLAITNPKLAMFW